MELEKRRGTSQTRPLHASLPAFPLFLPPAYLYKNSRAKGSLSSPALAQRAKIESRWEIKILLLNVRTLFLLFAPPFITTDILAILTPSSVREGRCYADEHRLDRRQQQNIVGVEEGQAGPGEEEAGGHGNSHGRC